MTQRYPFFRDEAERTQAVIGEAGIAADLNGTFEKPYAVLTGERLYCKTRQGNFITPVEQLLRAGRVPVPGMPGYGWVLLVLDTFVSVVLAMVSFMLSHAVENPGLVNVCLALNLAMLVLAFVTAWRNPKLALAALVAHTVVCFPALNCFDISLHMDGFWELGGVLCLIFGVVCLLLYLKSARNLPYEIRHTGGVFYFRERDYAPEELAAFTKAAAAAGEGKR